MSDEKILSILKSRDGVLNLYNKITTKGTSYTREDLYKLGVKIHFLQLIRDYSDIEYYYNEIVPNMAVGAGYTVFDDLDEYWSYRNSERPIKAWSDSLKDFSLRPTKVSCYATSGPLVLTKKVAAATVNIKSNNKIIIDGTEVFVPLRDMFEALGGEVTWQAATKTIGLKSKVIDAVLDTNLGAARVGLDTYDVRKKVYINNGVTYVELKVFEDGFGYRTRYSSDVNEVSIIEQVR